jgi:transcriptional regulator
MASDAPSSPQASGVLQGTLDTIILRILDTDGPLHGYGIARRIEQTSGERLKIEEGSLYPALRRVEKRGDAKAEWRQSETGREARFYAITPTGRKRLREATASWATISGVVNDILGVTSRRRVKGVGA